MSCPVCKKSVTEGQDVFELTFGVFSEGKMLATKPTELIHPNCMAVNTVRNMVKLLGDWLPPEVKDAMLKTSEEMIP